MLKDYFLEAFVFGWKWFALAFVFPAAYLPSFITDNVLFFWMDDVQESARFISFNLLQSAELIINDKGADYVGVVNDFITQMFAPYLVLFFVFYLKKNFSKREFRRTFTIDTLIVDQADLWPVIKPMVEVRPQKIKNLDQGEWAMGLEPRGFAMANDLIEYSENKMGEKKMTLKEDKVIKVFSQQLGRQWKSIEDLTIEERFLLAIFLTKANREGDDAKELAEIVATAYSTEKKYSKKDMEKFMKKAIAETDAAIQKYRKSEVFLNTLSQHYYVNTVLPRMLEMARVDGVFATADFVWLKIRNRTLWYILNNIGRNASWAECAGIWCHYNYEKAIERKIPSPNITGAVASLDLVFRECADEYIPLKGYNKDFE
jgi:intracellular multiplication protein IcmP